jgi:hypothetical protein
MFGYAERNSESKASNEIIYFAGPLKISVCG